MKPGREEVLKILADVVADTTVPRSGGNSLCYILSPDEAQHAQIAARAGYWWLYHHGSSGNILHLPSSRHEHPAERRAVLIESVHGVHSSGPTYLLYAASQSVLISFWAS